MTTPRIPDDERRRIRDAMHRAVKALEQRDGRATAAYISGLLGTPEDTVRSYLSVKRRPKPEFVRDLAHRAGLAASELFVAIGWLPAHEIAPWDSLRVAQQVAATTAVLERLAPHVRRALASIDMTAPAPVVVAQAVLADPAGAARFTARLAQVVSSGRYSAVTNMVAELTLRPGQRALTANQAERLARDVALAWRPDPRLLAREPKYWTVALELRARAHAALSNLDVGQYTWQGQPGTTTWVDAAESYPTHLLVQDALGGAGRPAAPAEWLPRTPATLVVVGGRHSAGPAAAIIAEALGWQFVPVRSDVEVTAHGQVYPVRRERASGRVLAWNSVAGYIDQRYRSGDPWRAVVLVRSSAFRGKDSIDPQALEMLRRTPARIVYARPPHAFLLWWAERQRGALTGFDGQRWVREREEELSHVESALSRRERAEADLCLLIPDPECTLPAGSAAAPAAVIDAQARVAWTAVLWLDEVLNSGNPTLLDCLQPGTLARWLPELRRSREPWLARLELDKR